MLLKSYIHLSHLHNLVVSRGQKGDQKGPISRKNEYFELKICNYALNQSRKLNVTQILHTTYSFAQSNDKQGSKWGSKGSKCALEKLNILSLKFAIIH